MVQVAEISWVDSEKLMRKVDVALLPVGSTEQHGPHNPLGTDHLVAAALSRIVGDRTGVAVLPVIPFGVSEHHRHFSGTIWVPPSVFRDYVTAVALSATTHGITKVIMVNGHGGNTPSLIEVAGKLRRQHRVFAVHLNAFPTETRSSGHAGIVETSINLYFHKQLVRMDRAIDVRVKDKLGSLDVKGLNRIGPADYPWDTIDLAETGVLGTGAGDAVASSQASDKYGKTIMEPFIGEICKFVEAIKKTKIDELLSKNTRATWKGE